MASGEYILYLDTDMILSPNLIPEFEEKCGSDQEDALNIPERIVGEEFWIEVRHFEQSYHAGTFKDAVRFVRRDLFLQVGGFDEHLLAPRIGT